MSDVVASRQDGVLAITFNRPDKKNALTGAMYEAIIAAMDEAEGDPRIGAVTLNGAGGAFTAGNDIHDFLAGAQRPETFPALRFIRRLAIFDKPLVAAVEGVAVGVGTTMLLHCDLIYAAPDAIFRLPFVDLGLVPEAGASLLLPARVGLAKATELLLLADPFDAREAERLGLVNAVVPHDRLLARAHERARDLAAKPRNALLATRRLMRGDRDALLQRIDEEAQAFMAALKSPEAAQAFAAFVGRRK
ncbi:MAG: enoyl-CoA hydratase [Hyphomicrobiales bacterium]|jgi:enoyl-CoA hydratase/carnithine racemase|nr:enoyl-CoA hydratase [Hyphomicrobiales bacterium]